jgi:hypothetical protein
LTVEEKPQSALPAAAETSSKEKLKTKKPQVTNSQGFQGVVSLAGIEPATCG